MTSFMDEPQTKQVLEIERHLVVNFCIKVFFFLSLIEEDEEFEIDSGNDHIKIEEPEYDPIYTEDTEWQENDIENSQNNLENSQNFTTNDDETTIFNCSMCNQTFETVENLNTHIDNDHKGKCFAEKSLKSYQNHQNGD